MYYPWQKVLSFISCYMLDPMPATHTQIKLILLLLLFLYGNNISIYTSFYMEAPCIRDNTKPDRTFQQKKKINLFLISNRMDIFDFWMLHFSRVLPSKQLHFI